MRLRLWRCCGPGAQLDYAEADGDPTGEAAEEAEKNLTYYELDLGLNHVVRAVAQRIRRAGHCLGGRSEGAGEDGGRGERTEYASTMISIIAESTLNTMPNKNNWSALTYDQDQRSTL